jgi:ParB-like chromosome segregation protein Spo0J
LEIVNQSYEAECPLSRLHEHPENARRGDVDAISGSIADNGFYGAIIAQRSTGYILAGNHRFRSAKQDEAENLPVIWLDVDEERARKILLTDNKITDLARYDSGALLSLLEKVRVDSGLIGTGYTDEEYSSMLAKTVDEQAEFTFRVKDDEPKPVKAQCPKCHHKFNVGDKPKQGKTINGRAKTTTR